MICEILSNYFQSWQIHWQNKKGISSIGTQCIYFIRFSALIFFYRELLPRNHYLFLESFLEILLHRNCCNWLLGYDPIQYDGASNILSFKLGFHGWQLISHT